MARCTCWYKVGFVAAGWVLLTVAVHAAGTIIKQRPPSALRQCTGDTLVLTVQAEPPVGESGLQYQWYKDGVPLVDGGRVSGARSNRLTIVNVVSADAGSYTIVVTTIPSGATEEAQTQVDIALRAQITRQPSAQTLCAGQQMTLSIQATGTIDGYQWYRNGSIVPGATEATYSTSAAPSDAGEWWCVVISPCGNVISEKVTVQVNVAPSIATGPAGTAVCRGAAFSLEVQAGGTPPLQYQWYRDGSPISGANQATYQDVAAQTGTYFVEVTNSCGTVRSQSVTVRVKEPPQITQQPQGGSFGQGARVELSVQATGEPPLSYQWYRNGVPIAGATSATYVIANMSRSDEGAYFCVVTNECGSDTSDQVRVTLTGIVEQAVGRGIILWAVTPHPVSGDASIRYRVMEEGWLRLSVLDLYGRPMAVLAEGFVAAGDHSQRVDVDALGLAAGTYIYQLETASDVVRQLMVVVR
ncbi:MAG: immunoglobulin domain-containing protein [Candidatus Kapabacteria bacterium]|nr:immunoglobulin domain-containing protein [Candidatus Kapabacteria bacterium]MCS7169132.1 immunoglobulin domain-containing protein [Candidatus Kapabacteria bacterium]MDW7996577.1 immunoglobulin domain-containing protein [Bacteroidota bacterium]MDW8225417.1 immunoglobulin domain-containing protein [Bacteroidota bacterium]